MIKQAVSYTLIKRMLSVNNLKSTIILLLSMFFSANIHANQTILLDANGVPLSDEVLLLLSSGSKELIQKKPSKTSTDNESIQRLLEGSTKSNTKAKNKKPSSEFKLIQRPKRPANPQLEEELLDAMKAGKIPRVKQLLRAGISPTFKNYKGETPLGIAVSRGWASMVISLLENGANIHEKGARGVTLLHVASAKGLTDVAKVLVRGGLSPSQRTDKNWTPLHVAARFNHWKLVRYYVSQGVDPDVRNSDGQTALGLARHLRHQSIIRILAPVTRRSSLNFAEMNLLKKKKKTKKKKRRKKRKT